ncbi:hypothetical protein BLA29_007571, partial [Euroglyphus maynei]
GIVGNVTLGGRILKKWQQYPLFYNWSSIIDTTTKSQSDQFFGANNNNNCDCPDRTFELWPSFYVGVFNMTNEQEKNETNDWFLDVRSCARKGVAFLNGHNIGRYWPVMGPQITLYIPNVWLNHNDINTILLFELESERKSCFQVKLTDQHILNGTIPENYSDKQLFNSNQHH